MDLRVCTITKRPDLDPSSANYWELRDARQSWSCVWCWSLVAFVCSAVMTLGFYELDAAHTNLSTRFCASQSDSNSNASWAVFDATSPDDPRAVVRDVECGNHFVRADACPSGLAVWFLNRPGGQLPTWLECTPPPQPTFVAGVVCFVLSVLVGALGAGCCLFGTPHGKYACSFNARQRQEDDGSGTGLHGMRGAKTERRDVEEGLELLSHAAVRGQGHDMTTRR